MDAGANPGGHTMAVIDAGNSSLALAFCDAGTHLPQADSKGDRLSRGLPDMVDSRRFERAAVGEVVALLGRAAVPAQVLVSVVPAVTDLLVQALPDLEVLDHTWKMPFAWGVDEPARVGPDRLANMALACAWGLADALVVDAGTATTFDLLEKGAFRGGLIAPGMAFAAEKLGEEAARLDPVPFGPCALEVGTDTAQALAAGAWHTGVLGVQATIEGLLGAYGTRPVILTGGLGHFLQTEGWICDPFWTLRGAAWLSLHTA